MVDKVVLSVLFAAFGLTVFDFDFVRFLLRDSCSGHYTFSGKAVHLEQTFESSYIINTDFCQFAHLVKLFFISLHFPLTCRF